MRCIKYPFQSESLELISKVISQENGVIVYVSVTFYALGCSSESTEAVKKIYRLKKRDLSQALLVLIDSWEMLKRYTYNLSQHQHKLLDRYWPGPLTAILNTKNLLAEGLNYEKSTLAFRMTSSPIAQELIKTIGKPMVGTSANLSGQTEVSSCQMARDVFGDQVDLYIDGGKTEGTLPTTLVDLTGKAPKIIREGILKIEEKW